MFNLDWTINRIWCVAIMCWSLSSTTAHAYRFEIIAEPGDVIEGRTITHFSPEDNPIAINNNREIVFMASVDGFDNYAIMTPECFIAGAGKVVDGVMPTFLLEDHRLSINDTGQVAYRGMLAPAPGADFGGRGAIFVDARIIATYGTVVDGRTITGVNFRPAINKEGIVAFVATYEGHVGPALFTQEELVVERGQVIDGLTLGSLFEVRLHDNGTIAYSSSPLGQNNTAIFTQERLLVESAENVVPGGPFVVNDVIDGRIIGTAARPLGISNRGEVAFGAVIASDEGAVLGQAVFTQRTLLVESGSIIDGYAIEGFRNGLGFNDRGMYSLLAEVPELGPPGLNEGLFVNDTFVIGSGDKIDGRTINNFHHLVGMNDRGDVAFLAHFDDGDSAIVVGVVPEPSTGCLLVLGLGCLCCVASNPTGLIGRLAVVRGSH